MPKTLTLEEIASRINTYLQRFAKDPVINALTDTDTRQYYYPSVVRTGRYVRIRYVSYHGVSSLTHEEAERYLTWLDAGNVGKHFKMKQGAV